MKVLALSSTYEPLGVIDWCKAVALYYSGKVYILSKYEKTIKSPSLEIQVPSVIVFKNGKGTRKNSVRFSRKNVWIRDEGRCQYCGIEVSSKNFTLDHVVPKKHGGGTSWNNVVTCCVKCNQKKADKLLHKSGLFLKKSPSKPSNLPYVQDSEYYADFGSKIPDDWKFWLGSAI